jgi:taurine dioxygenase
MTKPILSIKPLDPVGAEVSGLEGLDRFDAGLVRELNRAWADYGVLVFRGVASADQHLALSRAFGEIEVHPMPELRDPENPYFFPLGGDRVHAVVFDETDVFVNRIPWHRDTAYMPSMCMGAVLRMLEVPERGGETLLGDTAAAYDDLPADLRRRLDGLEILVNASNGVADRPRLGTWWSTCREARDDEYPEGIVPFHPSPEQMPDKSKFPPTILPAVFVHPESGRKCLFISPMNAECFIGMDRRESDDLLAFLVAHMTDPRFVYRHSWRVDDAVIWDNRRFIHAAFGNPLGDKRRGLRTTLATRFLVGRYADGSVAPEQATAPAM